ncbi:MAG TPA: hypothetical protein VF526_21825 [Solirubrobacteraceae bacterium]
MSLPEMLVGMVLAITVLGAGVDAFASFVSQKSLGDRQTQAQDTARTAIDQLATQLRTAVAPTGRTSPVYNLVSDSEIQFWAPNPSASTTNNVRGVQWIRYCLDYSNTTDEKLYMQTAAYDDSQSTPPAATACPSASWTNTRLVASNLVNKNPGTTTSLLSVTTDATSGLITDVSMDAMVDADTTKSPPATELKSSVNMRNANRAPDAIVSCRAQNAHALCDASSSSDPDGQAISYQWKIVCCSPSYTGGDVTWEPGQTSATFDKGGLTSGSTYRIDLRVTDSMGTTDDASATQVMP